MEKGTPKPSLLTLLVEHYTDNNQKRSPFVLCENENPKIIPQDEVTAAVFTVVQKKQQVNAKAEQNDALKTFLEVKLSRQGFSESQTVQSVRSNITTLKRSDPFEMKSLNSQPFSFRNEPL